MRNIDYNEIRGLWRHKSKNKDYKIDLYIRNSEEKSFLTYVENGKITKEIQEIITINQEENSNAKLILGNEETVEIWMLRLPENLILEFEDGNRHEFEKIN